ncbi:Transcriptional regulator, Crp/Fnr family OS=Chroococcidiopsis thermalis PCC 7203 GN=Chro_4925 PE=4 SV=1: HTH_Crp_2 [Gemmata massiliana]|uniref:Cyclic nucleotide-binding domain-containing protein n=1 Tax=Gemmata massiliana TaxID=1210884 RepID=A0A6P2DGH1_9BACT|nr:Crp/Fnr family transcriptional regulator [Gemmata massiliana]VTS00629.1 Transcriptional regulator, Crp/Fnr family OS=Chroococcidiopsis thermalis PCC 7203 GN=Chro_4925 PE=4 SV=1: HTH_Crp_2 [Gemmata massiliana]
MSARPQENRLLASLLPADRARLLARTTEVTFGHRDVVYSAGGAMEYTYFPRAGVLSAVVLMEDGAGAEVAGIGPEGVAGVSTALGADRSNELVLCQVAPCPCHRMSAAEFAAEVAKGGAVRDAVHRYVRAALTVSARQTACNCLHPADERCARWLLQCHDRAAADEFPLTHEFLSQMLGVRRATVTVVAGTLQTAGLITYKNGVVRVRDRGGLEGAACECYAAIRNAFA